MITAVEAWEALDSRGTPTVACEVRLSDGATGTAVVPSGASTGTHEALELRDGGNRYGGRGVLRAVANVNDVLGPAVRGMDPGDQRAVDRVLLDADGTPGCGRLGANAVLSVSVAVAIAAAAAEGVPLYRRIGGAEPPLVPMPMVNIISGGAHAARAVDVQDFLVVPVGAGSFAEAIEWAWRVRRATAEAAAEKDLPVALVADEGGLGRPLPSNRAALDLLAAGIERAGLRPGEDAAIAIDVAATQLHRDGLYHLAADDRIVDAAALVDELVAWCDAYPIVSIEDPLSDDDWDGWAVAHAKLGSRTQLLGDDLFATNLERLERGIAGGVGNAVLVKPNQNGTLTGAREVVERAKAARYANVVSARSGETEDSWLADLAVGWRAGQIKVGSTTRSERTAKWNRLLRIEAQGDTVFAGRGALAPIGG